MIIIVGASGSGKTTLQKELCEKLNYSPVLSTTTRPIRSSENGTEYNFVSNEEFKQMVDNNMFVERAVYNAWNYAIGLDQIQNNRISILTPHGLRMVKRYLKDNGLENKIQLYTIYLKVDDNSRLIKLLQTRDDMFESIRRTLSDVGMFDGLEDEVDLTIDNREYRHSVETLCDVILNEFPMLKEVNENV